MSSTTMSATTAEGSTGGRVRRDVPFEILVEDEAAGDATPEQVAVLEADRPRWLDTVLDRLAETDEALKSVRALTGPERAQVVADFEAERAMLAAVARRLGHGVDDGEARGVPGSSRGELAADGVVRLQLSWSPGLVVAWAGGPGATAATAGELAELLEAAGASADWVPHSAARIPGNGRAEAVAAPVGDVLGWLVALAAGEPDDSVGASARWLSEVAVWAVRLTAQGAMVPLLKQRKRRRKQPEGGSSGSETFSVRWTPALVDGDQLAAFAEAMPASVQAVDTAGDGRAVTRSALTGMVDAICRQAARTIEVPAPPPNPKLPADIAESFLGRLDGSQFQAPGAAGGELVNRIERWAKSAINPLRHPLVVQLDPPDEDGAWHLSVLAAGESHKLVSFDLAAVNAGSKRRELEDELARLERLLPALTRPGGHRRGEVILSQDEAWELMAHTGKELEGAGFDVRVPAISLKRPSPSLRLSADPSTPSTGGAAQLTKVAWSVLFDDVELDADEIRRLAQQARPLVRSGGRWVALDAADLKAAADALAERADTTKLSGAEMLRYALGLEGSPLEGGVTVDAGGWAAELLSKAEELNAEPAETPDAFVGELRSYQREALAWLGYLDAVGLGGCLALDMGLGKTPTMLAHLLECKGSGPSLVIAPPAVVGNWFAEAARFTPDLRVVVHHGASRATHDEIADEVRGSDVILTTYGTAVRDLDALSDIEWSKIVLDEAQAIKNPSSDTAQQLRHLPARMRIALTGTPIENGLGDLWAILDFTNPGLVGERSKFITVLSEDRDIRQEAEDAMRTLNGVLVFRRTKAEPIIAEELPDRIDELDHCSMTPEQIGLYEAVLDRLVLRVDGEKPAKGQVLAAITALKQICNHPANYTGDDEPLESRSGKLARLDEIIEAVYAAGERVVVFTQYAEWGVKLAEHLTERTKTPVACYHGGLTRTVRDAIINDFQAREGPGVLVLSLKAGGTGLNLTAANHVVLYDRWWNPAVEDQARDRAWRLGQTRTVIYHQLVCPGTIDERVEEVVAGKRRVADLVLPKSSSLDDLDATQLRAALGLRSDQLLTDNTADLAAAEQESAA
ncbi:MAG: hypothetical protein HYX32_12430 [Actinobacteria bacterium]|nr:hypothetical protein [Actinomycetota bacterium]